MKKSIIIAVLAAVGITKLASGQQDPQYTQYMLNTIVVNPAYAGAGNVLSVSALHRSQWIGLDGAPETQTLSIQSPLSEKLGIGLSVVNDNIGDGTVQETYFDVALSYTIPASRYGSLAFGLNVGGDFLNVDFSRLINYGVETNLPNVDSKFSPNVGVGVYYYQEKFYAGLSVPSLLETEHFDNSSTGTSFLAKERMNYYFISGYQFDLNRDLVLRPGFLLKAVSGGPVQFDLTTNLTFNDKFSVGAAYRLNSAVSALFGVKFAEKFLLGLAYDVETTALGSTQFNDGSFEVFLRYDFINRLNRRNVTGRFY
ncbi:PorP/SprF family type IX secretion system membrane protein [Flagellimonas flava]|uniref:Type IX secretion system membrane protein, PorP/SprF family n=1 Tax=Flagellimonas flava TaxID=570519 RepID=A0A1M5J862_9FLAO|nr:type IX secretion system membrane protein PorP/SprF [Allomuricauda flava]SHG36681.1 type IX secretion system membrane protein, PorP/SprF family [Allomuricauda flava]